MTTLNYWQKKEKAMQYGKPDQRPQDEDGMRPFLMYRRRKNFRIQSEINPNLEKIRNWLPPSHPVPENYNKSLALLDDENFRFVDTVDSFQFMLEHLRTVKVFAIDFEFNDDHSFLGMISLIQISTYYWDFFIDPFLLLDEIKSELKFILESDCWIKVMHGCSNDVRNLQRDFGIYIVGVIDTQIMYQEYKSLGGGNMAKLDNMAKDFYSRNELSYLSDNEKALLTLADYRQRPIPKKLKLYARADVHLLIRIYYEMKIKLSESRLQMVAVRTNELLQKKGLTYQPPAETNFATDQLISRIKDFRSLSSQQKMTFESIYNWRQDLAKRIDEKPEFVISVADITTCLLKPDLTAQDIEATVRAYAESYAKWSGVFLKLHRRGPQFYSELLNTICHNCEEAGHCAWGCLEDYSEENQQRYYQSHPNSKTVVNRHRRQHRDTNRRARNQQDQQL